MKKLLRIIIFSWAILGSVGQSAIINSELIYATDGGLDLIRVYDKTGNELSSITNPNLNFPTILEGYNDGKNFITDINFVPWGGADLVKMDLAGNILSRITTQDIFGVSGGGIIDVINSGNDTFFITSSLNTQIAELNSNLELLRLFSSGASTGGLRTLGGAVTNDGTQLYIADGDAQSGNGFIRIFDVVTGIQVESIFNDAIEFPMFLDFDLEGNLFLTDRGSSFTEDNILVFSPEDLLINQFNSGAPIHYNFGSFDLDKQGNLVMVETNFDTETPIRILSNDGRLISEFGGSLNNPNGIMLMTTVSVPEPSVISLIMFGLFGLVLARRINYSSSLYYILRSRV